MLGQFRNFHGPLSISALPEPDGSIHGGRVRISEGVINSIHTLTHDTYELVVKCDDDCEAIGGVAGQFATIRHADLRQPRAYSFARDPK